jgi:hypothetical protein
MLITELKLTRKFIGNTNSLFGTLEVITQNHGILKFSTVENYEKRIEQGTYNVVYTLSPKFDRKTLEITGVPNRRGIRIHPANRGCDVEGCIGIGLYVETEEIPIQIFYSRTSTEILEAIAYKAKSTPITIIDKQLSYQDRLIKKTRESLMAKPLGKAYSV